MGLADALRALLPRGWVWGSACEPETLFYRLLDALADPAEQIQAFLRRVVRMANPATPEDLLTDYEQMLGLPDACSGLGSTYYQRVQAVVAKLTAQGGQSAAYFQAISQAAGYSITIEPQQMLVAGFRAGAFCHGPKARYVWIVRAIGLGLTYFTAGWGRAGDLLASYQNNGLQCLLNRLKPAHTRIFYIEESGVILDQSGDALISQDGGFLLLS